MTDLDKLNFMQEVLKEATKTETRLSRFGDKLDALHQALLYVEYFKKKEEDAVGGVIKNRGGKRHS